MKKKSLNYYKKLDYPLTIATDQENGGYVASIPDLPGCFAWGKTQSDALESLEDSRIAWLEAYYEDYGEAPEPRRESDFSGKFLLRIPKSLHEKLHNSARRDGVSLNQYVLSLLSERNAYGELAALVKGAPSSPKPRGATRRRRASNRQGRSRRPTA